MTNTINWYEKETDDIYEHNSGLSDEESFHFINYLLRNYPELHIAWIDMFEEIKEHLFNEGRINDVLEFVDNYRKTFPGEYESEYEFLERDLITHLLYKGNIEAVKERLEIIKTNPVHGCDLVTIRVLFQLIYYGQFDLAFEYSNAVWRPLFESENLLGYPHAEFCTSIYLYQLEKLYHNIKNGKTISVDKFRKEMETYDFHEDKKVF
jgi:hypothetical protein